MATWSIEPNYGASINENGKVTFESSNNLIVDYTISVTGGSQDVCDEYFKKTIRYIPYGVLPNGVTPDDIVDINWHTHRTVEVNCHAQPNYIAVPVKIGYKQDIGGQTTTSYTFGTSAVTYSMIKVFSGYENIFKCNTGQTEITVPIDGYWEGEGKGFLVKKMACQECYGNNSPCKTGDECSCTQLNPQTVYVPVGPAVGGAIITLNHDEAFNNIETKVSAEGNWITNAYVSGKTEQASKHTDLIVSVSENRDVDNVSRYGKIDIYTKYEKPDNNNANQQQINNNDNSCSQESWSAYCLSIYIEQYAPYDPGDITFSDFCLYMCRPSGQNQKTYYYRCKMTTTKPCLENHGLEIEVWIKNVGGMHKYVFVSASGNYTINDFEITTNNEQPPFNEGDTVTIEYKFNDGINDIIGEKSTECTGTCGGSSVVCG